MKWIGPELAQTFVSAGTDAYRIADGERCRLERFGDGAILSYCADEPPPGIAAALTEWCERTGVVIRRIYGRRLVTAPGRNDAPHVIGGLVTDHTCVAHEEGLAYAIDLAGYSCGLFIDQRANRSRVRASCSGRLLNLFSYTCSFSVVAAMAGARTVSIDLSKAALEYGRRNFALNHLSTNGHRFIVDDALDVLPRLARRGERFEWIILDPPTFSRGRGRRVLRLEKDFGRLIEMVCACAAPAAMILLSTNCSTMDPSKLRDLGRRHVSNRVTFFESPRLPDVPAGRGASTIWMQVRERAGAERATGAIVRRAQDSSGFQFSQSQPKPYHRG
jgi:23S rRNA (cytosine1962-C5)-methyltransferase